MHKVQFYRNRFLENVWKAECSCGWWHVGTRTEVECRAGTHDISEWEEVRPIPAAHAIEFPNGQPF